MRTKGSRSGNQNSLWQDAASFAAWKHRHQIRKDGQTPYIAHTFRVAMTVRQVFGCDDPVVLAAAMLHDTIEDTLTDYDELESRFGVEVADIVAALTKNMTLREDEREKDYDARLAAAGWQARLIKLADVFDNHADMYDRSAAANKRMRDKCRRALELAEADAEKHECTRRAIAAVKALLK